MTLKARIIVRFSVLKKPRIAIVWMQDWEEVGLEVWDE
ncbi:hypothetical protein MNB_SUP05-SYMBIONT-7-634 [hydrothermal vent metagenome]|uniref:Uncharacterized protein n=1 Tax=hydrothermal vent metagenome TaxID=652676 RepID=A0A1W1E3X2_9ZZZZ